MIKTNPEEHKPARSKYELTLSEFPLFLLSGNDRSVDCIRYDDTIKGKNDAIVKREWAVYPDSKLGFGTASTMSTLFELFQIWRDEGFDSQSIHFGSIYNLVKRKGLKQTDKKTNERIRRDLSCLVGVKIEAKNAFWDNERKAYVDMIFHLFDSVYFFKENPGSQATLPLGQIKASDVLFGSVLKNSLLTAAFDSEFFHKLTPLEQRLALYLTKIFRSQSIHKRDLAEFGRQIPLKVTGNRLIKQVLKKACQGLMSKGFISLESFRFEKASAKKEFVVFVRSELIQQLPQIPRVKSQKESYEIEALTADILDVCGDVKSTGFYKRVAELMPSQMIYRALSEVKEVRDLGEIKKNKGALFTNLIKKYAKERGVEL